MKNIILIMSLLAGSAFADQRSEGFKQVILSDFVTYIKTQNRSGFPGSADEALESLMSYYEYTGNSAGVEGSIDSNSNINLVAKNLNSQNMPLLEGKTYGELDSRGVLLNAELSTQKLRGWEDQAITTADELIQYWLKVLAQNAAEGVPFKNIKTAYISNDGVHIGEVVEKTFYVAMSFAQSVQLLLKSNDINDWNRAYLAFGAAADFQNYTDTEIKSRGSIDSNNDGFISLVSEKNYGMAVYAANTDLSAKDGLVDFTGSIASNFAKGRELLNLDPQQAKTIAKTIVQEWEKLFAAKAVGYLNKVIANLDLVGTASFDQSKLSGVWTEMKILAMAPQYSPVSVLSTQDFDTIHELMKSRPVLPSAGLQAVKAYRLDLLKARKIFQDTYQFSEINVNNW